MRDIPPVESLVDALHDPIHPASGSLIRSQTVKGSGGVDKTDIVWRLRDNWSYLGREAADEITRLRNQVEQLRGEVADAKKWAMQERSQRWNLPGPLSDEERDAIEWAAFEFDGLRPDNGQAAKRAAALRFLLERLK